MASAERHEPRPQIRRLPCEACPYRRDAPSGLWARDQYEKLLPYDQETWAQPRAGFSCHAAPELLCHGWALVGGWDLLALRLMVRNPPELPEPVVPLFASHTEAAEHGLADLDDPDFEARVMRERLLRKYPRLIIDGDEIEPPSDAGR